MSPLAARCYVKNQLVDASEHQRHDAGREAADHHTRHDQGHRRGADRGEQHGSGLDQKGSAQCWTEAPSVADMPGDERTDDCTEAVQHPVARPRGDALSGAFGRYNEVNGAPPVQSHHALFAPVTVSPDGTVPTAIQGGPNTGLDAPSRLRQARLSFPCLRDRSGSCPSPPI
jgi:hypothetical protein